MKRAIKILFVFIFALALFSIGNKVQANSIQSISMDIFVDDNGDVSYETIDEEEEFNIVAETYELLGEELEGLLDE